MMGLRGFVDDSSTTGAGFGLEDRSRKERKIIGTTIAIPYVTSVWAFSSTILRHFPTHRITIPACDSPVPRPPADRGGYGRLSNQRPDIPLCW